MAELKTKKTTVSVEGFLKKVADPQQREDALAVLALMKEITGSPRWLVPVLRMVIKPQSGRLLEARVSMTSVA